MSILSIMNTNKEIKPGKSVGSEMTDSGYYTPLDNSSPGIFVMRDLSKNFVKVDPGDTYGILTIIKEADRIQQPSGITVRAFLCRCDCGNGKIIRLGHLRSGKTKSCGCLNGEDHGMSKTRLYRIWRGMKDRCYGESSNRKKYYQDRNIIICDEWKNSFTSFMTWSVLNGYSDELTIDRKDNYKNYCPENCRWVTVSENRLNAGAIKVMYNGLEYYFINLLRLNGKMNNMAAIRGRIKRGWTVEDAFNIPIREGNYVKKES